MNIEQIKALAKLTKKKENIEILVDEDNRVIDNIIAHINILNGKEIRYNEDELNVFIKEISIGLKEQTQYTENAHEIISSMVERGEEISINELIGVLKFYREEKYNQATKKALVYYRPVLSYEDFIKIYDVLKKKNFKICINKFTFLTKKSSNGTFRTIDEISKMIGEDNGLSPKQIEEVYFDKDMIKHRTYEESKKIGDMVASAYKNQEYVNKIKQDEKASMDLVDDLAVDSYILSHMSIDEHLKLLEEFISDPSLKLYNLITNRDLLENRTYEEILQLIKLFKLNKDSYCYILIHRLLLLPIEEQLEYVELLSTTKSPYIKEKIINDDEPITREYFEKLKELDTPISVREELGRIKSINDFIRSLEENGISDFTGDTMVYTKKKNS